MFLKDVRGSGSHSQGQESTRRRKKDTSHADPRREEGSVPASVQANLSAGGWGCLHFPCKEGGTASKHSETEMDWANPCLQTGSVLQETGRHENPQGSLQNRQVEPWPGVRVPGQTLWLLSGNCSPGGPPGFPLGQPSVGSFPIKTASQFSRPTALTATKP